MNDELREKQTLKTVMIHTEDVLHALESIDYESVGRIRAKVKTREIKISPQCPIKVLYEREEVL